MKNILLSTLFIFSAGHYLPGYAADTKFSLAQIPDTQSYFYHPGWADPGQVTDMYQWIIDDQKNNKNTYQYIFHVGDIIEQTGLAGPPNAEALWEWNEANSIFNTIENNMNTADVKIPYGFATGNHDTQNLIEGKDPFGNGDLLPNTTQQVIAFLKARYDNKPNNVHQSIAIPDVYPKLNPSKFPDTNYLISYRQFQIDGINFIALNVPYFLAHQAPLATTAVNNFIKSHASDSLVIVNSHDCGQGQGIAAGHKNVFMIVCGHNPSGVNNNGSIDTIPAAQQGTPSQYIYRFDYQAVYTGKGPSGSNYLPQHPLVRTYDFTINTENGTLSWNANDIQPWSTPGKIFNTDFTTNPKSGPATFAYKQGSYGWAPKAVFDPTKKMLPNSNVTINYKDYLGSVSTCAAPVRSDKLPECNKKTGTDVTICWDNQPGSNPKNYIIEDHQHTQPPIATTTDKSFTNKNVGTESHYDYYLYAVCEDGSKSPELLIDVPGN